MYARAVVQEGVEWMRDPRCDRSLQRSVICDVRVFRLP